MRPAARCGDGRKGPVDEGDEGDWMWGRRGRRRWRRGIWGRRGRASRSAAACGDGHQGGWCDLGGGDGEGAAAAARVSASGCGCGIGTVVSSCRSEERRVGKECSW